MSRLSISDVILMSYAERERRRLNRERVARGEFTKREIRLINKFKETGKVPKTKSRIGSLLLILFFGSLGYMYVSFRTGLIIFLMLAFFTYFLPPLGILMVLFMRIFLFVVGAFRVNSYNEKVELLFLNPASPYHSSNRRRYSYRY